MVGRVLRNPFYTGVVHDRGDTVSGAHEAIIGARLWRKVQERMALQRRYSPSTRPRSWSPLYRCGVCGSSVIVHSGTSRPTDSQYRCQARTNLPADMRHEPVNAPCLKADHHLWQAVRQALDAGTVGAWVSATQRRAGSRKAQGALERATEQLEGVRLQLERAVDAYMRGLIDGEMFEARARPLRLEEEGLQAKLLRLEAERPAEGVVRSLAADPARLDRLSSQARRDFLSTVLLRVEVHRGHLTAVFRLPDEPRLEIPLPKYWSPTRGKPKPEPGA